MKEAKKLASRVEAALKRADPTVIAERVFHDELSDRLYITIFKGPRKTEMVLPGSDYGNGDQEKIDTLIKRSLERLKITPIG